LPRADYATAYVLTETPEANIQFGTGMLLRAQT